MWAFMLGGKYPRYVEMKAWNLSLENQSQENTAVIFSGI